MDTNVLEKEIEKHNGNIQKAHNATAILFRSVQQLYCAGSVPITCAFQMNFTKTELR